MLYHQLLKRKNELSTTIQNMKHRLSSYPDGELICTKNGNYITYLHSRNGTYTYIPKKNLELINILAEKKLAAARLEDLEKELQAVNAFLKYYKSDSTKLEQLLSHSSYQKILAQCFQPDSESLKQWVEEPYEKNPSHPDALLHPCPSGHIVRSKSEALIDQALFLHNIPFRYECSLHLKNITLYPDFTIRHPTSNQYFYWEHFGLMDSPSYVQNVFQKLNTYCQNNIIPTINLITTYETKEHPLASKTIETIIQEYFAV